jgi:hypothetical protein
MLTTKGAAAHSRKWVGFWALEKSSEFHGRQVAKPVSSRELRSGSCDPFR